jgi:hypothetical protein
MVNARIIDSEGNRSLDKQVVFESEGNTLRIKVFNEKTKKLMEQKSCWG